MFLHHKILRGVFLVAALRAASADAYPLQPQNAVSENVAPGITTGVLFEQKLNASVSGSHRFRNEIGEEVRLDQFFGEKPVILGMVYYGCPNLCTMVLNGLFKVLEELPFDAGKDFTVLLVSIDPTEKSALAQQKKATYLKRYHRAGGDGGIHFLTGEESFIKSLANEIGFRYRYDEKNRQYAHPGGLILLTPNRQISRYLYGIEYPPQDLRLALTEASANKIGSLTEKFLLLCYHYDPSTGTYGLAIMKAIRVVGIITILSIGVSITWMLAHDRSERMRP